MTYESQSARALQRYAEQHPDHVVWDSSTGWRDNDYALPSRYLPPAFRGGFANWLERHGYTLLATLPTGPDAAVVLVDRTSEATPERVGFDRYVTWRVYAGQDNPEAGYYTANYASAVRDFLARGGVEEVR